MMYIYLFFLEKTKLLGDIIQIVHRMIIVQLYSSIFATKMIAKDLFLNISLNFLKFNSLLLLSVVIILWNHTKK